MRAKELTRAAALLAVLSGGAVASDDEAKATVDLPAVIHDAVSWLVQNQNADGSWGSHHSPRPIEVLADVPGSHHAFRVATTALCVMALSDSRDPSPDAQGAIDRGIDYLLAAYDVKRPNGFEHYNVWSFGYTLHCLGERLLARPEDPRAEAIREACGHLVRKLALYQALDGGWGYLSIIGIQTYRPSWTSMSFTTATILVGVDRVRRAGVDVPDPLVGRAVASVRRSRTPDGAFVYGEAWRYAPRMGVNQVKGAACRTPLCQYVLGLFGEPAPEAERRKALDDLLVNHARFQRVSLRRPIPHESWYQISGYFYLYGHAYASYVLEAMPEEDQDRLWPALIEGVMVCRQPDGSFWDYPLYSYHKPYGTAFALIALSRAPGRVQGE